jgi:hypothetical protein
MVDLPFKYRAAVVLRHVMGMDYSEAARELDLPLNTYKSHLLRGTKLRVRLVVGSRRRLRLPWHCLGRREPVAGGGNGTGRRRG